MNAANIAARYPHAHRNRSSTTEMVSVPPYIGLEPLVGRYYPAQCRRCGWVGSSEELTEEDAQCTRDAGDRLCLGDCDELERHDLLNIIQAMAAPQPHAEPVALPQRKDATHHWVEPGGVSKAEGWNACLDEIAKLGALHSLPVKGEMVGVEGATFMGEPNFQHSIEWYREGISKHWKKICEQRASIDALQKQLAEVQALLRTYESFPGYLIDHCEGDTIYEESLQHWLAAHIRSLPAHAEQGALNDCAICRDLGNQCMECEEVEFREWADRHFAAADYRKTDAGVFIQDWMRHSYGAWCARGSLVSKK